MSKITRKNSSFRLKFIRKNMDKRMMDDTSPKNNLQF